ncbi:MAG TPA: VOC family protein [Acidimicrobiales bacterium]
MAEVVGIAHLVLRVNDWGTSARWYQDVLGFQKRKGEGYAAFANPDGTFLLLFRPTDQELGPSSSPAQHLDHIAMHVASLDDLEAWRVQLAEKGIETEIEHASVGSSITLHDPDGREIELFTPADGSTLYVPAPGDTASSAAADTVVSA